MKRFFTYHLHRRAITCVNHTSVRLLPVRLVQATSKILGKSLSIFAVAIVSPSFGDPIMLENKIVMVIYGTASDVLENLAKITEALGLTRLCGIT